MRELIGEVLLSVAVWIEGLAVRIGNERVAKSFIAAHKDPRESFGE